MLKIKPTHYAEIAASLDAVADKVSAAKPEYQAKGWSDMRLRWDAFRFAKVGGNSTSWLCSNLYPYLNDAHIDSALRHYFSHKA